MEETTPEILSKNNFQQITEVTTQQIPTIPQNQIQVPPSQEENNELLIGIYLKKEQKTIDYYFNSEQLPLIFFNKNIIVGMLENIKLDVLIGENKENE